MTYRQGSSLGTGTRSPAPALCAGLDCETHNGRKRLSRGVRGDPHCSGPQESFLRPAWAQLPCTVALSRRVLGPPRPFISACSRARSPKSPAPSLCWPGTPTLCSCGPGRRRRGGRSRGRREKRKRRTSGRDTSGQSETQNLAWQLSPPQLGSVTLPAKVLIECQRHQQRVCPSRAHRRGLQGSTWFWWDTDNLISGPHSLAASGLRPSYSRVPATSG